MAISKLQNTLLAIAAARPVGRLDLLAYLADVEHYRRTLRTISGATYAAELEGPRLISADATLDLLATLNAGDFAGADWSAFGESESLVLRQTIKRWADAAPEELRAAAREGAWSFAWNAASPGRVIRMTLVRWIANVGSESDRRTAELSLCRPSTAATLRALELGAG